MNVGSAKKPSCSSFGQIKAFFKALALTAWIEDFEEKDESVSESMNK